MVNVPAHVVRSARRLEYADGSGDVREIGASFFSYMRIEAEISSRFRRSVVTVLISGIGSIRSGQDRSRWGMARFGQGRSAFAKPFAEPR
jgi:hypothetical protein